MSEEIKEILDWLKDYNRDRPFGTSIYDRKILSNYITNLQQKVEQLEKENIKQKEIIENLTTMTVCGDKKQIKNTAQYKLEQLENIRKEAIEYLKEFGFYGYNKNWQDLLNILNKGDNK